jgi:hypothetical protein
MAAIIYLACLAIILAMFALNPPFKDTNRDLVSLTALGFG